MKLTLKRIAMKSTYTIGKLYIDDVYFCDTLEDKVRDLNKDGDLDDPGEAKVWGESAIPYGTYKVCLCQSLKFGKVLPRLMNVKGFEGILIHPGNTSLDTHGCILVGRNTVIGKLTESKSTFDKLMQVIKEQPIITIQIQ